MSIKLCNIRPDRRKKRLLAEPLILLLILLLAVALLASSCSGKKGDGGTTATEPGNDSQTSDGEGEDASATRKPNASDGADENGADEEDDVFATSPSTDLPPDVREQIESFQDIAGGLPMDDVASADALRRAYGELAFEGPVNDALFFTYELNMQFVCEGLNSVYEEEPPDDETIADALENGFLFIDCDAYSAYFILRPDFLDDTFSSTVSAKVQAYLNLQSRHYQYHLDHDFIENDTLMVSLDQLAEMIVDWENYINLYRDAVNYTDITENLDYYLKIYIGSIQIENSGLYMVAGVDETGETLYKLMDEPRQSYLRFIENYQDSAACPLIAELYQIYKDNDFLYSIKVEDFFRSYGLAYDV